MQNLKPYLTVATRRIFQARQFTLSARTCQQAPPEPPKPNTTDARTIHHLTTFDKKVLVWTGKYKTIEDIPEAVNYEALERARNRFRIKVCNYAIVLTILGCIAMIFSGKAAAKRGESVQKMNLDFHELYNSMNKKE